MPSVFVAYLKSCTFSHHEIVFIEATRILFTFIVQFGLSKNHQAPLLYKSAVASLTLIENLDHVEFMIQSFMQIMGEIPSLPAAPLTEPLLKLMDSNPSPTILQMVKIILA